MIYSRTSDRDRIVNLFKKTYNCGNPKVNKFFVDKKIAFYSNKNNFVTFFIEEENEIIALIEGFDLAEFPIPVVEKKVLYINTFYINDKYKQNVELLNITSSLLAQEGEKYSEIMFLSSPVEENLKTFYHQTGFKPLLNYENFLVNSKLWLFKNTHSFFIKRIPINFDQIHEDSEKNTDSVVNLTLYSNFCQYFYAEIYFFINDLKLKFGNKVSFKVNEIITKENSIFYGTDFCVLLNDTMINPVNLMMLDFEEYIKKIEHGGA